MPKVREIGYAKRRLYYSLLPRLSAEKYQQSPVARIAQRRGWPVSETMNWLQERGLISDECVESAQVAPSDVQRLLVREHKSRVLRGDRENADGVYQAEIAALQRRFGV